MEAGFYKLDFVNRVNKDGSDGFGRLRITLLSMFLKVIFAVNLKDCTAFPCRQMNSKGLGNEIVETFPLTMPFVLIWIGAPYDPDTFLCESAKRYLRRDEISQLIAEVP